jgi:hypothetical protein
MAQQYVIDDLLAITPELITPLLARPTQPAHGNAQA